MKNDIRQIFGDDMTDSIEGLVSCYEKMDLTTELLVEQIKDMHELSREG